MDLISIISLIMSAAGMGISGVMQQQANDQNIALAQEMNKSQQDFSRESAERANEMTRQNYFELYSPQAKVRQFKEAGLNPALMYSMGGTTGSGQAAAQAAQPAATVPYVNPLVSGNAMDSVTNAISAALQNSKTKTEEENIKKDTEKKDAEIKKLQSDVDVNGEEIKKIAAETNLANIATMNASFDGVIKQLDIELKRETNKTQIEIMSESLRKLREETNKIIEETRGAKIDNDNKQKLIDASLRKMAAETSLLWKQNGLVDAETALTKAKEKLTDSQTKMSYVERQKAWAEVFKLESEISRINGEIDLMQKQGAKIEVETITEIVNSITNVAGTVANLAK